MATVEISPIEVLALKKLALINGALAKTLVSPTTRAEQTSLLRVLMDVTARAKRSPPCRRNRNEIDNRRNSGSNNG